METEELIEDYLVYTDNGIERVHWCNVNGVKELVSPKGKVYGYVPDYFEVKRLQEQLKKLKQENTIHNNKAKKRRIHINNLKNENNQLREQLKEKNIKLNELRHQRNEANEALKSLIAGDKNTLYHLNKILPEVKNNKVTYDYMKMIVEDFEDDLKEIEKRGVK